MINKQIAYKLLLKVTPRLNRREAMATIAKADSELKNTEGYDGLGDARQSALVFIYLRDDKELLAAIVETLDDPVEVSKLIGVSGIPIASALACQYKDNKVCTGALGCNCGRKS